MIYQKFNKIYEKQYIDEFLASLPHRDVEKALRELSYINASAFKGYGKLSAAPCDVLQRYDLLEAHLDKLKSGEYFVCINYKKKGIVELRRNPRPADHLKVLEKVTKEEKNTQAALHRFAVEVRKVYQSGITIIGKTHALKSFGKRIVDAALCIKESENQYYSCAAPRQYYDKNTLVYMKLEQIENEDK